MVGLFFNGDDLACSECSPSINPTEGDFQITGFEIAQVVDGNPGDKVTAVVGPECRRDLPTIDGHGCRFDGVEGDVAMDGEVFAG